MAKRYAFWRSPSGSPHTKDDGKFAPTVLLSKIGEATSLNCGKIVRSGLRTVLASMQYEVAISSLLSIIGPEDKELNETDTRKIVSEAIKAVVKKQGGAKPISAAEFIANANRQAADFFRQPTKDFALITSLNLKEFPARSVEIEGCRISALKNRSRFPMPDALAKQLNAALFKEHVNSTEYLTVKVKTYGRSVHEATDTGLNALNLLRGLWNLFDTYGTTKVRLGGTRQKSIAVITTGPVHTLHQLDGKPAVDVYWYEPTYSEDSSLYQPKRGWKELEKDRKWATRRFKKHPFAAEVKNLVIRYSEALDQTNLDVAFLQMWSMLEKITNTIGGKYDQTIRRATWIFNDDKVPKELLEFLRMRRNQFVHAARASDDTEQIAYMMKRLIDPHLDLLIANSYQVQSLREYGEFLGLPKNLSALEARRDQINVAIRKSRPSRKK
ncbi:MAG: hypothetical protein HUJ26_04540 [Planctomycetaceae bacterium]|nr:hypothetical protein [Planctomycetaceae bacterium]